MRCHGTGQVSARSERGERKDWGSRACTGPLGEAAGTAAALAVEKGVEPRQVDNGELQRRLVRAGVLLE